MNIRQLLLSMVIVFLPVATVAAPPDGEYYRYWSESDVMAYVAAGPGSYEVSGKYVAVMTYEENPKTGQYAMIGELFDCAESYFALAEMVEYDGKNIETRHYSNDNVKKSFKPVEEDTRQEFLLIGVCSEETLLPYDQTAMRKYFVMIDEALRTVDK